MFERETQAAGESFFISVNYRSKHFEWQLSFYRETLKRLQTRSELEELGSFGLMLKQTSVRARLMAAENCSSISAEVKVQKQEKAREQTSNPNRHRPLHYRPPVRHKQAEFNQN